MRGILLLAILTVKSSYAKETESPLFLIVFLSGDILLVASFLVARFNWRPDLPPYNLRTRSFDVLLHPAKHVRPAALRVVRTLQLLGILLLLVALLVLARQALHDFSH